VHAEGAGASSRRFTARHSSSLTSVIESRLPRLSTRIVASSGAARISASESRRVFFSTLTSTCHQRGDSRLDFSS
jgi:hypothetical protein